MPVHQIATGLHKREGAAVSNFPGCARAAGLRPPHQITKDPYALDFLAIDSDATERQLEDRLVDRVVDTLRELGRGFAFVGRQVQFDVDGDDFFIDLLFFQVEQPRYVVIELKTKKFEHAHIGQLGLSKHP